MVQLGKIILTDPMLAIWQYDIIVVTSKDMSIGASVHTSTFFLGGRDSRSGKEACVRGIVLEQHTISEEKHQSYNITRSS